MENPAEETTVRPNQNQTLAAGLVQTAAQELEIWATAMRMSQNKILLTQKLARTNPVPTIRPANAKQGGKEPASKHLRPGPNQRGAVNQ